MFLVICAGYEKRENQPKVISGQYYVFLGHDQNICQNDVNIRQQCQKNAGTKTGLRTLWEESAEWRH